MLSNFSPVTKWTKDYPGSPVEPSMSERGPAEWDGHWVGESYRKTKLTFQRTGTLFVFPLLVGTHEIVFLVHFNRNITYLQWLKKYSPIINHTVHICKENIIYWCFFLHFRILLFRKLWQTQLRGKKFNIYTPVQQSRLRTRKHLRFRNRHVCKGPILLNCSRADINKCLYTFVLEGYWIMASTHEGMLCWTDISCFNNQNMIIR